VGLSKSKSKQTNAPSAYAMPFINQAGASLNSAIGAAQPVVDSAVSGLSAQLPALAQRAFSPNAGITAATDYNTGVLNGDYLTQDSPGLGAVLNRTSADVTQRVGDQFTAAGRTGSGANQTSLARGLGDALGAIRYGDYNNERQRQEAAAGRAGSLVAAENIPLASYLDAVNATTRTALAPAQAYAGGIGSLFGGYNTSTTTQSPSLGAILAQVAGNAARAYAGGGG